MSGLVTVEESVAKVAAMFVMTLLEIAPATKPFALEVIKSCAPAAKVEASLTSFHSPEPLPPSLRA